MLRPPLIACVLWLGLSVYAFGQDSVGTAPNSLEVSARLENYPAGAERTYLYLQYGRKIRQADIFAKALRYTVGKQQAWLFEAESYIKYSRKGYAYLDVAWSGSEFLPNYRARGEVYRNWKRFEVSLGGGVVQAHDYDLIPLATGTLGYYFSDYFVYVRPTLSWMDDGVTKSLFVQGRRYFNKTDFLAVSALRGADTGVSRNMDAIANTFGLDTWLVRLNGRVQKGQYRFGAGLDYGGFFIPARDAYMNFVGFDVFVNRTF